MGEQEKAIVKEEMGRIQFLSTKGTREVQTREKGFVLFCFCPDQKKELLKIFDLKRKHRPAESYMKVYGAQHT